MQNCNTPCKSVFNKSYQERLAEWREFRSRLETAESPIHDTVEFFLLAPTVAIQNDPYNQQSWPDPWEMINENLYCEFTKLLAVCYTLQLTERFSDSDFEIHIAVDKQKSETFYLLYINDTVVGYDIEPMPSAQLPSTLVSQEINCMPKIT